MRIVNRKEFLSLPAGTVYTQYESRGNFGEICIKDETVHEHSWRYQSIIQVLAVDEADWHHVLEHAEADSNYRLGIDECLCCDESYDESDRFAVLDSRDIEGIIGVLQQTINIKKAI